ncbi:MAG: hypothetical protein LBC31_11605 [Treponema sp.]|jgi:hypothetical protein|nr:hypothetical protein [Treponema sp.]
MKKQFCTVVRKWVHAREPAFRRGKVIAALLFLAFVPGIFAQTVNREELEQNQAAVNFINYEGPHSRIDTVEQIRNIGYDQGRAVRNGAVQTGTATRYFVIHCVGDPDGDKFDADIFGLGVDVGVDHIRNLRLIIQGYLEGAYDYSASDAALLARYVTIYNAVFRGDWNFFDLRYKNVVIQNMVQGKEGLSIRWDEWPGQTLMVIPLGTGVPGSLSAIDTSGLTDPGVIAEMRGDEDKGIDDRQGMVDLKEREADEANQSATLQREAIAEEEKNIERDREASALTQQRIEQEQRQTQQQRQEAQRQREEAQRQQQEAQRQREEAQRQQQEAQQRQEQTRRDEEARRISQEEAQRQQQEAQRQQEEAAGAEQEAARQQQEADQKEQEAVRQQQDADRKEQELARQQQENQQQQEGIAQREQAVDEAKQEADATQQRADQKTQEAQQEREQIAQDQQDLIDNSTGTIAAATSPAARNALLGAGILQGNNSLGRLVRVDPSNGSTVQASRMNTLNTRTVTLSGTRIFAIAGINQGNGAIRLVEISSDTLEMIKQGDDDISQNSLLWTNGGSLYAITTVNGKNYLARFDNNLARQAQSAVEVHPYASCIFQGDSVLTQGANGNPLLLNGQTLK